MIARRLLAAAAWASTLPYTYANLLDPLTSREGGAEASSLKFQPALDSDMDSCYHVVALDLHSNFNEGQQPYEPKGNWWCRSADRLMYSNAYVRRRCNHGWCAYMYGYYFEKDEGTFNAHRHDWEHVIVWTLHGEIFYVSWSAHGDYSTAHKDDPALRFHDGTHVKIVNHLGGSGTHSLRLATGSDEPPENHWGQWFIAWLVEVTYMEPWSLQLVAHDWGHAHPDFGNWLTRPGEDDRFGDVLKDWAPWDAVHNEGFDPYSDAETWTREARELEDQVGEARWNVTVGGPMVKQDL